MAGSSTLALLLLAHLLLLAAPAALARPISHPSAPSTPPATTAQCLSFVYAFGDSTTDTGNAIRLPGISSAWIDLANSLPYGSTFFGQPTGRFSDGRLMLDFLCEALNISLSLVLPHLEQTEGMRRSDNFAIAGSTALAPAVLQQLMNATSLIQYSLDTELNWFQEDIAKLGTAGLRNLGNRAWVYFGEMGGNDYNYALASGKSAALVATLVPQVVQKLNDSLEMILSSGLKRVVVQGEFPMGCMAIYLQVMAADQSSGSLDAHGCVAAVSAVSDEHNQLLQKVVQEAAARHPDVELVFLDTTGAYLHVLEHASDYGFTNVKDACFDLGPALLGGSQASAPAITPCSDPQHYVSWDGIHMTDTMYRIMTNLFLDSGFSSPSPNFLTTAPCR